MRPGAFNILQRYGLRTDRKPGAFDDLQDTANGLHQPSVGDTPQAAAHQFQAGTAQQRTRQVDVIAGQRTNLNAANSRLARVTAMPGRGLQQTLGRGPPQIIEHHVDLVRMQGFAK